MNTHGATDSQKASLSQGQKTALFGAIACLAVMIAVEPWRGRGSDAAATAGTEALFPKFTKAAQATGIQITKFDEATGKPLSFSVKLQDGRWIIPSHEDYPADATQHMAEAAVSVLDLKPLGMVSDRPGDFQIYGVVAPDTSKIKPGDTGIGTQVVFKGANDSVLSDLIIGKASKEQPDLRYVRVGGRDQVYQVKLNTDKLSTKFSEWIEKDLLKINAFDIREVQLNDYSLEEVVAPDGQPTLAMVRRSKMKLDYDDAKSKWNLVDMVEYKKRAEIPAKLADDEELNSEKLNAMRNALDDLKIVDVQRKPAGLSKDLRVTEAFVKDREAALSLQRRGFYSFPGDDGQTQILSTDGEVVAFVKDGVGYTLRFGEKTLAGDDDKDDAKKDEPGEDKSKKSRLNRYLFISCQFLEDRIPKPELKELPTGAEDQKPSNEDAKKDDNAPGDAGQPAADPAIPNNPAEPAPNNKPAGKQSSTGRSGKGNIFHLTADEKPPAAKTPAAPTAGNPAAAPPTTAAQPADGSATPAAKTAADETADAKPADAAPAGKTDAKPPADLPEEEGGQVRAKARAAKALADERTAIEKENKRQQTEYDEKITKGRAHAKELNDRFADWYYVISDEVYHKIHLSREDVIKKKDKAAGKGDGLGDFDALQKLGPGGHMHEDGDHDHK